jgi:hypothetical protein
MVVRFIVSVYRVVLYLLVKSLGLTVDRVNTALVLVDNLTRMKIEHALNVVRYFLLQSHSLRSIVLVNVTLGIVRLS